MTAVVWRKHINRELLPVIFVYRGREGQRMTILYSILHLLVDGLCAMAMFGRYIPRENGYFYILLYNFCAFALQMPFGVMLDAMNTKRDSGKHRKHDHAFMVAALGVLCAVVGAVTHPVVLGIGNALFHVGGGVGTIREDHAVNGRGTGLGIFVAPGALGLYLGTIIAAENGAGEFGWNLWFAGTGLFILALLMVGKLYLQEHLPESETDKHFRRESACRESDQLHSQPESTCGENSLLQDQSVKGAIILSLCCLLVVILRSYIGMAVGFPWKTGVLAGLLSVFAVVGGKMAGGFLAAWKGAFRMAVVSLMAAAFCYLFSSLMPMGLAALFLFNMTMPVTLYWMVCAFPQMPGSAFGFLTFALFLGFLPGYFGMQLLWNGNVLGCAGSVLSLLLLAAGLGKGSRGEQLSD